MIIKPLFTIIIPVHNGSSTLKQTLNSIKKQKKLDLIKSLIIVDDNSTDQSKKIITDFKNKNTNINIININHSKSIGLARSFNEAIKKSKTKFIILAHQDIIIQNNSAILKLEEIISSNDNIFYIYPTVCHPKYIWKKYNFWQKCLFARYVDKKLPSPVEKFDCIDRQKFTNIGLFDEKHFRTAGEDLDIIIKAKKEKLKYIHSDIKIIHLHNQDSNFSFKNLVKKEKQLAETKGVLLRIYGPNIPNIKSFFREAILISLFIPYLNKIAIISLIIYIFGYNWRMYQFIIEDKKVLLLPLINFYLFLSNILASAKAFLNKKQLI